jgi:hypothetical protein
MEIFDVVVYIESALQTKIVAWLIDNEWCARKVLVVAPNKLYFPQTKNAFDKKETGVDLHGYKKIAQTFGTILKTRKSLKANLFVASHSTGLNSLFWEAHVEYNELGLIDDGTGTLISLEFNREFESARVATIFRLSNVFFRLLGKQRLRSSIDLQKLNKHYFSIYHKNFKPYETHFVPLFSEVKDVQVTDEHAFVGQPLVELGQIDRTEYIEILKKVQWKLNHSLLYFPHPKEDISKVLEVQGITIMSELGVEDYYKFKRPAALVSIFSSVLLNFSLKYGTSFIYYIPYELTKYSDCNLYYKLMDEFNINRMAL